jgi:hypothetical protein
MNMGRMVKLYAYIGVLLRVSYAFHTPKAEEERETKQKADGDRAAPSLGDQRPELSPHTGEACRAVRSYFEEVKAVEKHCLTL